MPPKRRAKSVRKKTAQKRRNPRMTLDKLRQSEERLRLSQAIGQIGSYEWDLVHDTAEISAEMERIYGLKPGEFSGDMAEWRKMVHPEDLARLETRLRHFFAARDTTPSNEFRIHRRNDGSLRWIESRGRIDYDRTGRPLRIVGVNIDVTDRKLAQLQIAQSEHQFRSIVETANEGIWFINSEAQTLYANERLGEMLGYTVDEIYALGPVHICYAEDVAEAKRRIQRNLEGDSEQFDFRFRRKDGKELLVLAGTSPVRDGEGHILGALGMFTDVTDRKHSEQALQRSMALLHAVNEGTSNLIFAKDFNGRITYGNQALFDFLQMPPAELLGKNEQEFLSDSGQAAEIRANDLLVLEGKKAIAVEERIKVPSGERVFASNKFPQFDSQGNVIGLIGVSADITEQKSLQQKLALRFREFEALAVSTPGFLFTNLADGANDYTSRYFYEYTGALGGTAAGHGWADFIHPEDRERMQGHWLDCVKTGKMFEDQCRFRRHDGDYRWFAVRNTPMRDPQGKVIKWYGIAVDIQNEKLVQEELAVSEERYRLAMTATNDAIWDWDLRTNRTVWNTAVENIFLYSRDQVLDHIDWWSERVHPDDAGRVLAGLHSVIAGSEVHWQDEYRFQRGDGSYADVHDRGSVMRDARGKAVRMIGAMADITERKRAEQASLYLASIVESSHDPVISMDLRGTITSWNRAAERLFGYATHEAVGRTILMLVPPQQQQEETEILSQISKGEVIQHYETVRVAKNGERIDVALTVSPIYSADGHIVGASKISRDIREQKQTRAALIQSEKLASVGRLSMTIAHEINNPLEAVTNLLYLIGSESGLGPNGREYLRMAENEIARVSHIAKQTLGFYRDSSTPDSVDTERLIRDIVQIYSSRIHAKNAEVIVQHRGRSKAVLPAGDLRQVLSNLVSNALDAISPGGRIMLRIHGMAHAVRFTISDNGVGIRPELRSRIFEPFFTTKRDVGTGLGLWVTRQLLAKNAATIRMRSTFGEKPSGTVFSVLIPETAERQPESPASEPVRASA